MKKLKLNIMAIIGMMVAVGTVAFTAPAEKTVYNAAAETWFYQLMDPSPSLVNDAANYSLTAPGGTQCGNGTIVCSIQAEENPSIPGQPLLEHGDVTDNADEYSITRKQ